MQDACLSNGLYLAYDMLQVQDKKANCVYFETNLSHQYYLECRDLLIAEHLGYGAVFTLSSPNVVKKEKGHAPKLASIN